MPHEPFIAIGNDQLGEPIGDTAKCPKCGAEHQVSYGERVLADGTREPSKLLAIVKCGEHAYLVGLDGRSIVR